MQDDLFNFYELFGDGGSSSTDEPLLSTDDHVMFSQFLDNLGGGGVSNSSTAAFDWTTGSGSSSEAPLLAQLFPATTSTTTSPTLPQQHQQHQHQQRKRSVDTSASLSIPAAFLSDPPPPATSLLSSSLPKRLKSDLNFPHSHSHSQSQAAAFADMLPFFHSQSQQMPQVHIMPPSFNPLYSTSSILPPSSLMQHHYAATYNNQHHQQHHHHHQQFMPSNHHEGLPTPSPPMHSDPLFKIEPVSHVPALAALPSSALRPTSSSDAPAPKRRGGRKPKDSDSIDTSSTASSTTTTSANASSTTTKKQSLLSTQEKKQNHILAEQRRRQLIRDALKELTLLVPGLRPPIEGSETSTDGSSRVEILEGSRAFIERLKQENEVMRGLIAATD
ncbi:hypothetical protein BCR33DRAFT_718771 [Rhizoclosmatium globosum]|uniref:BHLH domain-containing protein n=1 Tax=Rhizoclosmatium globosum TaxID=329046 RepID=A0A1Y2C3Z8_9FUNG|nr:hypothetical protein BCR33DRAFT_718771 [Rhizoclosmatium globosum]|eukprot:ORY41614.1 hypothetical protein BCR33DRAFT_718771 [Rhizoclosmatium globosum]